MKNVALVMLLSLVSISIWAAETPKWGKYVIKFPVSKDSTLGVSFSYEGRKYVGTDKTQDVSLEKKKNETLGIEERFITNIVGQNATGDREKILDLWSVSERPLIEKAMDSNEAVEKNAAFFRNIEATYLISVMKYDAYYLFVVEHTVKGIGSYMKLYPAVPKDGGYLMTNALKGDVFYEKIIPNILPYMRNSWHSK